MRVFVGYGYNERDKWIEEYIFPLLVAMGCEVGHGKVVFGGALSQEIIKEIQMSDAMIGFTTRRESLGAGTFQTHDWVVKELTAAALSHPPMPWVEVREDGVRSPGGPLEDIGAQRIDFTEADRAKCLVQIAQAIGRFQLQTSLTTVRLGPTEAVDKISALLRDSSLRCTFQILRRGRELSVDPISIFPIQGALVVHLRGIARGDLVRISVFTTGRAWRSSYVSVDTVDVQLVE